MPRLKCNGASLTWLVVQVALWVNKWFCSATLVILLVYFLPLQCCTPIVQVNWDNNVVLLFMKAEHRYASHGVDDATEGIQ